MKYTKTIFLLLIFSLFTSLSLFAGGSAMSPYTLQKYTEFTSKRAIWSTYTDANKVIQELDEFLDQVNAELPGQALDLEQEQLFWESSVRMGKFEYIFWTPGDVDLKKIRLELKDQMKEKFPKYDFSIIIDTDYSD